MIRRRGKRITQIVAYTFSAIVVLSMVIGLIGPILMRTPTRPTPTWPPTWTPLPTPTLSPTWTPLPTSTLSARTETPVTPVVDPSDPLVFAVAGDNRGNDAVYERLLERVVQDGNAFLIHTGDMVDYGSRKEFGAFQELMADFPLPFYPVPGNHDRHDDGSLANYVEFSGAPARHYSFDVGTVHFTMANTATGHLGEEELAWIDRDLAATDRPVRIVTTHYPPFDPEGTGHVLYSGSEALMDLMRKHDVAYVFLGHIHAYSREERDGTVYVITGGAGSSLYSEDPSGVFYHYVQVTVEGTQVSTKVVRIEGVEDLPG